MRYWLTDLVERFDPHYHLLRQAVRTAMAAFLGLMAFYALRDNNGQAHWVIIASVFLAQARLGATQWQMMGSIVLVSASSLLIFVCGTLLALQGVWLQGLFLVVTTVLAIVIAQRGEAMYMRAFYTNLMAILSLSTAGFSSVTLWQAVGERVIVVLVAMVIALLVSMLWWHQPERHYRRALASMLRSLSEFLGLVTDMLVSERYLANSKRQEYRLHERRARLRQLMSEVTLRHQHHHVQTSQVELQLHEQLRILWEGIVSLSLLRFRMSLPMQEVALANELTALTQGIQQRLTVLLAAISDGQPITAEQQQDLSAHLASMKFLVEPVNADEQPEAEFTIELEHEGEEYEIVLEREDAYIWPSVYGYCHLLIVQIQSLEAAVLQWQEQNV